MGSASEQQTFLKNGPENRAEIHELLSEARYLLTAAVEAAKLKQNDTDNALAARAVFQSVLNTINPSAKRGAPGPEYEVFLASPILEAFGFFRDRVRSVSLRGLNFDTIHYYDLMVLHYSKTILWERDTIELFFEDLVRVFSPPPSAFRPFLLPRPRVRAYQLCRVGLRFLDQNYKSIGIPPQARIILPGKNSPLS